MPNPASDVHKAHSGLAYAVYILTYNSHVNQNVELDKCTRSTIHTQHGLALKPNQTKAHSFTRASKLAALVIPCSVCIYSIFKINGVN